MIARASFSIPATIQNDDTDGVKTRWKRVQKLSQQFWSRWQADYLSQLRCHAKWTKRTSNVQVWQIVLVGDDNLPVGRWPMGIVTRTYVGSDDMVRVADIRTSSGTYKRNVRLLAPLPIDAIEKDADETPADLLALSTEKTDEIGQRGSYHTMHNTISELEDDQPPSCSVWDGRLRPKGGRNGHVN